MKNIAIFASGSGTNAENIIRHLSASPLARVSLVLTNNPTAGVLERAARLGVEGVIFSRSDFEGGVVLGMLDRHAIDLIVLAGFLWLAPPALIERYRGRIVNIHPALLPKYGGRGMYGDRVHRAVVEAGESESGITIHHVDELYDNGLIIAQYRTPIAPDDTPDEVARKVHELEYRYFPQVIEELCK